ncbi:hypothetical protein [Muribaculum intestinale]|nr:hypothetical protein [Muribaculum intestinale]
MNLRLRLSVATVAAAIVMTSAAMAQEKRFYASVYSTNEWKEYVYSETGMYSFPLDKYSRTLVKEDSDLDASGGGTMTDDFYFCTSEINYGAWTDVTHYTFKPDSWQLNSQLFGSMQGVATDLAYDHTTARIYGCFATDPELGETEGEFVFGSLNEATGQRLAIRKIDTPWIALGCDRSGSLYAVDMAGILWKVEKTTGATEQIADLGVTANRRSTGAFDTESGIFYVVVTNEDSSTIEEYGYSIGKSQLYAVDVAAGSAKLVYEFADGEAVGGMYIPGPLSDDNAPAQATDFSARFSDGALNGTVSFTIPDKTFGGNTLEGDIKYLVRANGSLFAQGTASPGTKIEADGKVDEDGAYEIELELTNAAGRGPKSKISQWIGHDTPVSLSSANLTYADGAFTLTWAHPTSTEHGGYMNHAMLSYDVTRMPDNVRVATAITSTAVTDPVEIPASMTGYSYRIDMSYRGVPVSSLTTDTYNLGSVSLPYVLDFDSDDSFDGLTIIDANGDRNEWYREEYWYIEATDLECTAALYPYSSVNRADDWMILPAIMFEKGITYSVEFQVSTAGANEKLALYFGTAPSPDAMTGNIMPVKEYESYCCIEEKHTFTPEASGLYYIGFHACSDPDGAGLGIRDIKVDTAGSSAIEEIPTETTVPTTAVYNLQGVQVDDNARGGIFIEVKANGTTRKIVRR